MVRHFLVPLVTEIAVPAFAVALSPVPVVLALVLLVHNSKPRVSSAAYLVGRAAALTLLALTIARFPGLADAARRPLPHWVDWAATISGVACVSLGALLWRHGNPRPSRWPTEVGGISPFASAALGLLPPFANPKVMAASATAAHYISGQVTAAGKGIAVVGFVILACSTVALPIATHVLLGPRIEPELQDLRRWIHDRQQALRAIALIVIGVALMLYGLT